MLLSDKKQRKRELSSLLMSLAIHSGLVLALSAVWVVHSLPEPPEAIELEYIKLPPPPAPSEGQPIPGELLTPKPEMDRQKSQKPKSVPTSHKTKSRAARMHSRAQGPTVDYKVRVADARCPPQRAPDEMPQLMSGWQAPAPNPVDPSRDNSAQNNRATALASASHRKTQDENGQPTQQREPEFHLHDHGQGQLKNKSTAALPPVEEASVGGSRQPLIDIIQSRLDKVAPLVKRTSKNCRNASGLASIRFLLNRQGYPLGYQITSSSGNACLDDQINLVLHLAEPYPYVAGWVPAKVKFTL